jgi:hypothetical protein
MIEPYLPRLLLLLAGLVVCFRGYSAFRVALALTGFLVGAHVVAARLDLLPADPAWLRPAAVVLAGLLVAAVILAIYRIGVMLLGAAALVFAALSLPDLLPVDPTHRLLALALAALLGGLLSRFLERVVLSVLTAVYGGFMLASGLTAPMVREVAVPRMLNDIPKSGVALVLWVVMALLGTYVQLRPRRQRPRDARPPEPA